MRKKIMKSVLKITAHAKLARPACVLKLRAILEPSLLLGSELV